MHKQRQWTLASDNRQPITQRARVFHTIRRVARADQLTIVCIGLLMFWATCEDKIAFLNT